MKAILVIDMPANCEDCPLHYRKRQGIYRCEITHKNIRLEGKPSWCPLKPMPDRKDSDGTIFTENHIFGAGWNACIDELMGEEE